MLKLGLFSFVSVDFHQEKWIYVHKGSTKEVSTVSPSKSVPSFTPPPPESGGGHWATVFIHIMTAFLGDGDKQPTN